MYILTWSLHTSLKFQSKVTVKLGSTGLFVSFTNIELRQKAHDRTGQLLCDLLSIVQEVSC